MGNKVGISFTFFKVAESIWDLENERQENKIMFRINCEPKRKRADKQNEAEYRSLKTGNMESENSRKGKKKKKTL